METCLDTEICLGSQVPKRWWDQEGLVFPGIKAAGEEGRAGDRRGDRSGGGDRGRDEEKSREKSGEGEEVGREKDNIGG